MSTQNDAVAHPAQDGSPGGRSSKKRQQGMWDRDLVRRSLGQSVSKLNPRTMARNPVMFVVEVGSVLTTIDAVRYLIQGNAGLFSFTGQISLWLWLTVLFANFAEAMAEGRGQAHADELRKTRTET